MIYLPIPGLTFPLRFQWMFCRRSTFIGNHSVVYHIFVHPICKCRFILSVLITWLRRAYISQGRPLAACVLRYYLGLEQIGSHLFVWFRHGRMRWTRGAGVIHAVAPSVNSLGQRFSWLASSGSKKPSCHHLLMHHRVLEDTLFGFRLFLLKGRLITKCSLETFVEPVAILLYSLRVVILEHRYNILRLLLVKLLHPVFVAEELVYVLHALFL